MLLALTDPLTAALYHRPSRIGVESAWYGHVPFGMWLVGQTRPLRLVELGTHAGVSYSALCDSVLEHDVPARCFAVDTWRGDAHAGFYGEDVYEDFRRFHDLRYQEFSSLLRMSFDDALEQMANNSIDLLHIDGLHSYEAVRHDFDAWLPKLTDRAVVLLHDTNVRERGFGVWRLWQELRQIYPGFEFMHASGLGVLAVGHNMPSAVEWLCTRGEDTRATEIREYFAALGERWETECQLVMLQAWAVAARQRHEAELLLRQTEAAAARKRYEAELRLMRDAVAALTKDRDVVVNSTIWRATAPLRSFGHVVPLPARQLIQRALSTGPRR